MTLRVGEADTLFKVLDGAISPVRLFAALRGPDSPHAFLLESADMHTGTAERSLGAAQPCLRIQGRGLDWEMASFNRTGEKLLLAVQPRLDFVSGLTVEAGETGPTRLRGTLPEPVAALEERRRLELPGPMDLLRAIHGVCRPARQPAFPPGGLFGAFAYDFVDCFESLPPPAADPQPVPDFVFYFADHLFVVDHVHDRTVFVATALGLDRPEEEYQRAQELIVELEAAADSAPELEPLPAPAPFSTGDVQTDMDDSVFADTVTRLKDQILAGDVFQVVPSRSFQSPLSVDAPLQVYRRLRRLNPSPYMFFLRMGDSTLLGASPETALRYKADTGRVEIRPIAGTRPRGFSRGRVDHDLDSRYEADLRLDEKELAEHMMLVDLARNDVARVSTPGTRRVDALLTVEKYSHVQHLVSRVSGTLRDGLDPLHAYLATMNMGTLTGAPKVEAMRLLRKVEKTRRGFYGGAVGYYMLNRDFDTAIIIRSLLLTKDRAVARAGAGVVYDSVPRLEAEETWNKARAPLTALGLLPVEAGAPVVKK